MAKYATPEKSEVYWVTTIADYTAPTAAELNAGVSGVADIRGMPAIPRTGNTIDVATIDSKFEKRQVGTRGGDTATMEILRDDATETFLDALSEDTAGFLVLARKGLATYGTWAIGDEADVFPATVLVQEDGQPGRNDPDSITVSLVITDTPERGYSLAA